MSQLSAAYNFFWILAMKQGILPYRTRWITTSSKSRRVIPCFREQYFLFLFFASQNCASWVCRRRNAVNDIRYFRFSRPSRLQICRIWSRIIRKKASSIERIVAEDALFLFYRFHKISRCKILAQSSAI